MKLLILIMASVSLWCAQGASIIRSHGTDVGNLRAANNSYYPSSSLELISLGNLPHQYLFSDVKVSFFEASYFCNSYGMDLVTLETIFENDNVQAHILGLGMSGSQFFTSGHTMKRSTWQWIDGTPLAFINWCPSYPSAPDVRQCLALQNSCWVDAYCESDYSSGYPASFFVCETRDA